MSEQQTFLARVGGWFKRNPSQPSEHYSHDTLINDNGASAGYETRSSFLRPWAKRDAAIERLQHGFDTLTDLMNAVRQNLEQQNLRQDELIKCMGHLPQLLDSMPEASRMQGETLKAMHMQLAQQNNQQERLAEILSKMSSTGTESRERIESLREQVDSMRHTDQAIVENLSTVGAAMQTLSHTGQTSATVLQQMRDNIHQHDAQVEQVLARQGTRFTTMLAVAIFLATASLVAVSIIGYLLLNKQ